MTTLSDKRCPHCIERTVQGVPHMVVLDDKPGMCGCTICGHHATDTPIPGWYMAIKNMLFVIDGDSRVWELLPASVVDALRMAVIVPLVGVVEAEPECFCLYYE